MEKFHETSKFLWLANWVAIDYINTAIVVKDQPVDLLESADDFILWLRESGLCDATRGAALPRPAKRLLEEARAYRSLLRQGISDLAGGRRLSAALLRTTNAFLRRRPACQQLEQNGEGYCSVTNWHFQGVEDFLVPIAESFAKLVTEATPGRVRKCRNPKCVLYFYDTSKGNQRAWCSLDLCGNKLRMAASRERRSADH